MRREYIEFKPGMDIDFKLATIEDYPLVWHNCIRIFFVLKGAYTIGIENEEFSLEREAIEIINQGEPYYISSRVGDNLVLILDIKPEFFKAYNDRLEEVYYYTDTLDGTRQTGYKYRKLREYIAILFYEFIGKEDGFEDKIEDTLLKTMYHLLNNFHYLIYEEESLKEDQIQLARFTRIISYLKKNYWNRVSLKEIAEREFLTPQYLSYKIKDTFGQNFNDFLNKIRVDESRKLLLDTDKSISEIGQEVGFSHSRYYNKHFKKIHGHSPQEYREKYKKTGEELKLARKISYHKIGQGLEYLRAYLGQYSRYNKKRIIVKENIDLDLPSIKSFKGPEIIDLEGDNILESRNYRELGLMVEKFSLKYLVFRTGWPYDAYETEAVLKRVYSLGLTPILAREDLARAGGFLGDYRLIEDFKDLDYLPKDCKNNRLAGLEDLYRMILSGRELVLSFRDKAGEGLLSASRGLLTRNYLKKPSYLALELVGKLGQEVIYLKEQILVTRSSQGFEVLLFNSSSKDLKRFALNIEGLRGEYFYLSYKIDLDNSLYYKWDKIGRPAPILGELGDLLRETIRLKADLGPVDKGNITSLVYDLDPGSSLLISLRRKLG